MHIHSFFLTYFSVNFMLLFRLYVETIAPKSCAGIPQLDLQSIVFEYIMAIEYIMATSFCFITLSVHFNASF